MRRLLATFGIGTSLLLSSGCALCCAPYDCDYLYQGGRWVRTNPSSGRVGSVFDPAGEPVEPAPTAAVGGPTPMPLPAQTQPGPQTRSVIPRNMGQTYLP